MDFNLKALGAETVMVDRRIVAQLAEAELLLRDGEKLPYQFIRQNSFIGVNPSERLFAKRAVTGKNAECIGVMVKPREIVLAEEVYYRVQELETAESIEKIVGSFSNVDNALKLQAKLNGMGYHSIIMKNSAGMSRVSIAGFDEEASAREELLKVREQYPEFADAWLLISKQN